MLGDDTANQITPKEASRGLGCNSNMADDPAAYYSLYYIIL